MLLAPARPLTNAKDKFAMATSNRTTVVLPLPIAAEIIEIPLTRGYIALVDAADDDLVNVPWRVLPGRRTNYAMRTAVIDGRRRTIQLHREIMARVVGRELFPNEEVDHIHGNGLDNRRSELRLATREQNAHNMTKYRNNTSGYKGVCWDKRRGKWSVEIAIERKKRFLGYFDDIQTAASAYRQAADELHGEFAKYD